MLSQLEAHHDLESALAVIPDGFVTPTFAIEGRYDDRVLPSSSSSGGGGVTSIVVSDDGNTVYLGTTAGLYKGSAR